jgi:hypothetical protein
LLSIIEKPAWYDCAAFRSILSAFPGLGDESKSWRQLDRDPKHAERASFHPIAWTQPTEVDVRFFEPEALADFRTSKEIG